MVKQISFILILGIILGTLCSCYDAKEVDAIIHVLVIGIDKGVSDKWRLTVQFSTLGGDSGNEEEDNEGGDNKQSGDYTHITIDSPSFFAGLDMLNASLPRELSLTHIGAIVISEELAQEGILGEFITPLIRYRQIRRSTHLVVSKGSAMDFIKANEPFIGTTLSKAMQTHIKESANTGYFGHTTLSDFYSDLRSTYRQPIIPMGAINDFKNFKVKGPKWGSKFKESGKYTAGQLPRKGENKIEYFGTALFHQDKMVAEINGSETRTLLMIRGEFKRGFFTVKDPKKPELIIPLDIRQDKKPKVKINFAPKNSTIDLTIYLKGDILAIQSGLHYEENPLLSLLEETFKKDIESRMNRLILKCQKLDADVFKFGDVAARHFKTIDEWETYNWNNKFGNVRVNTRVEFIIKRAGTRTKGAPIPESGKEDK